MALDITISDSEYKVTIAASDRQLEKGTLVLQFRRQVKTSPQYGFTTTVQVYFEPQPCSLDYDGLFSRIGSANLTIQLEATQGLTSETKSYASFITLAEEVFVLNPEALNYCGQM